MGKAVDHFFQEAKRSNSLDFYLFLEQDLAPEARAEALLRFLRPHPGKDEGREFPLSLLQEEKIEDQFFSALDSLGLTLRESGDFFRVASGGSFI